MSPPAIYLTTTLSHTHVRQCAYAIDNAVIEQQNTTTSAELGIEPWVVSTWVNYFTNMTTGYCMAFDVV